MMVIKTTFFLIKTVFMMDILKLLLLFTITQKVKNVNFYVLDYLKFSRKTLVKVFKT